MSTYDPGPGVLSAYRPSSPLAPRPICAPASSMSVSAARGTTVPSECCTVPQTGLPPAYDERGATGSAAEGWGRACGIGALRVSGSVSAVWWDTSGFSLRKKAMSTPRTSTGTR